MSGTHGREPVDLSGWSLEQVARQLDEAHGHIDDLDPLPKQVVTDGLSALTELHRRALTTIVKRLKDDPRGKELLFELVDDPGVRLVFSAAGIIRPDPSIALRAALARVGSAELVELTADGVARVRLVGSSGCGSTGHLRDVEDAALACPGVRALELVRGGSATVIPVEALFRAPQ
ncbi:MAG: hypothetical protein Q4G43_01955 [Mobilicoccus sp.]|nr:hypothetical protein [Mobilicoccus sp.]